MNRKTDGYMFFLYGALLAIVGALALVGCPDDAQDTTPPNAVSAATATTSDTEVTLLWTNPADSDFDHIEITWTPADNGGIKILSASESGAAAANNSVIISGLASNTTYTFAIIAVDTSGNKSTAQTTTATPGQDSDNDGIVDISDSCPMGQTDWISDATNDNDGDGCRDIDEDINDDNDGELDDNDNCPLVANDDQTNSDNAADGGDACDDNDDNDTILDASDSCPIGQTDWISDAGSDSDSDGCRDIDEDIDDDNDGLIDIASIEDLSAIRDNLAATNSVLGAPTVASDVCATNIGSASSPAYICGYELLSDLDFNADSSYLNPAVNKSAFTSGLGWDPLGASGNSFRTRFEGNSYTISNLYINRTNRMHLGLFGHIQDGVVRNLTLADATVMGGVVEYGTLGVLAGTAANTIIENVTVDAGSVVAEAEDAIYVGGLVGWMSGAISNAHASATAQINGETSVFVTFIENALGGLVGWVQGAISDSSASGDVIMVGSGTVGGLIGRHRTGAITTSFASGMVSGVGQRYNSIGGLIGSNDGYGDIVDSYATGDVSADGGNDSVGGLIGNANSYLFNSYATGDVYGGAGNDKVGGLLGFGAGYTRYSYASGNVYGDSGDDSVGGLVGDGAIDIIFASYANGASNGGAGNDAVGGLVGLIHEGGIYNSYASGGVDGGEGTDAVGGLLGRAGVFATDVSSIYSSYASNDVSGGSGVGDTVGALIGTYLDSTVIISTYTNSDATISGQEMNGHNGSASVPLMTLTTSSVDNSADSVPFYRWQVVPDGDDDDSDPDWVPQSTEEILIYCDTNYNKSIDSSERVSTNYIWDFGSDDQLPAITCTPGGLMEQRP